MDILSYILGDRGHSLPNTSIGDHFSVIVLKSGDLAIIALNTHLCAPMRLGKGPPALCLTHGIYGHITVGILVSVQLGNLALSGVKIAPNVPRKRLIGTNSVAPMGRGNSCSMEEVSNTKGDALGETKPGSGLIVID